MTSQSTANVLVVDDEVALADSYAAMIGTEHEVQTATGGAEALAAVDEDVDVMLLDRRMPAVSGLDVVEELNERDLDCQIVLCSAVDPDLKLLDYGFDDYLHKPVGSDELLGTIDRQHRLAGYDEGVREYFALEAKREAIEDSRPPSRLDGEPRYETLLERIDRRKEPNSDLSLSA